MVKIPHLEWQPGNEKSKDFRLTLDFLNSYAENMWSFITHSCESLVKESEEIKKESEGIKVADENECPQGGTFGRDFDGFEECDDCLNSDGCEDAEHNLWKLEDLAIQFGDKIDEAERIANSYTQIFFESLFITIHSLFQKYLNDLCNEVRKQYSLLLKYNDLSGSEIERIQKYLKKVANLYFPDDKEEWKIILLLREIRNNLVHDPGRTYHSGGVDPKLRDYLFLEDPNIDGFFEDIGIEYYSKEMMFSVVSIKKVNSTLSCFVKYIDVPLEKRDKLRKKFAKGPKHKK